MQNIIWLALFIPLFGFLVLMTTAHISRRSFVNWIGCGSIFLSLLCFTLLLITYTEPISINLFRWIPVDRIHANFQLLIDPLSLVMTMVITGVGFLIHLYAVGYIEHEEDYARFFACMNFFVFSMLLLVLAGNLLLLFVGWEGVGLASYLLIGFWYHRPAAAQAATKAFVVNRIGDWGFLIGLLLTFKLFGTSDIAQINQLAEKGISAGPTVLTLLTLLYFCGAVGKSAQVPLHVWLPDAMEGPTPVSALIHAATMVTAGVYLVVRMHPIFLLTPTTLHFVGYIGAITALFAALCALAQTDLKRVLAYSTVSQLGYMFLACGVGAFYAAMFHLMTHAFVKGLLFLSAGSVVHMMQGTTDMNKMGGLRKIFNKTNILFLIGALSMSGIPPLAIFFSKDLILEQEYETGFYILFYIGLLTSILTAFYMTRAYCLTFLGKPKIDSKILKMVKEAPTIMIGPTTVLAIFSILGGFIGYAFSKTAALEEFLSKADVKLAVEAPESNLFLMPETWISIVGALLGVFVAAVVYTKYVDQLGHPILFLRKSFYIDQLYEMLFVKPLKRISTFIAYIFEPKVIEGSISMVANGTERAAGVLQLIQSGQLRSYVAWIAIGMCLLILFLFL